jgi:DNA polymerase
MFERLHFDFETMSAVDLKACGADVYARHPSTDILCFAYKFDDGPTLLVKRGEILPPLIRHHVEQGGLFTAHNFSFEFLIWNYVCVPKYGWPRLSPEQGRCTVAMAYAMGLPGSLEKAAAAAGITQQKDMAGSRVMMQLSQPRTTDPLTWWEEAEFPEKYQKLYDYCVQDVKVEHELELRLLPLSSAEQETWVLDSKINQRGVRIDVESATKAITIVEMEQRRLNEEMQKVTGNQVASCTATAQLTEWIRGQGVDVEGVAKNDVTELIDTPGTPAIVLRAVRLRQEAAKSSTAKLKAMINGLCADGKVRGMFQYHGAAATGRWAGRRIQFQNLPRPVLGNKDISKVFEIIKNSEKLVNARDQIDLLFGPPMSVIADLIRGMIVPSPENHFIAADFSAIEARVLAWLAGEESVLQVFRTHGKIYEKSASGIYAVPLDKVTKEQRQIGKVAILALGYQGGVGAFQQMAKVYGIKVPDAQADQIKLAWRQANPNIVQYWYDLERAAIAATEQAGQKFQVGAEGRKITYLKNGSFLFCKLPSGRVISYPYPRLEEFETPWGAMKRGLTYMSEDSVTKKWGKQKAYGGLLCENITQAVARDVLAEAMHRLEAAGYPIVMHIHDEIVADVPKHFGSLEDFEKIMAANPSWAKDLPLSAEGWIDARFRK